MTFLLQFNNKKEITIGKQICHNEIETKESHISIEEVEFKNSIECTKNYNNLVLLFSNTLYEYGMDNWTYNQFPIINGIIEIFRYGNHIKIKKTINKTAHNNVQRQ